MKNSTVEGVSEKYIKRADALYKKLFESRCASTIPKEEIQNIDLFSVFERCLINKGRLESASASYFDNRIVPLNGETKEQTEARLGEKKKFVSYVLDNCYGNLHYDFRNMFNSDKCDFESLLVRFKTIDDLVRNVESLNREKVQTLARDSTIDELTGLYNRRFLTKAIERNIGSTKRLLEKTKDENIDSSRRDENKESIGFSLIYADVDDFGIINDAYGHPVGDSVLRNVADIMIEESRREDICARLSGGADEFSILLPMTSSSNAEHIAKRLVKSVQDNVVKRVKKDFSFFDKAVTISAGIASYDCCNKTQEGLIWEADSANYLVKKVLRKGNHHVYQPEFKDVYEAILDKGNRGRQAELAEHIRENLDESNSIKKGYTMPEHLVPDSEPD